MNEGLVAEVVRQILADPVFIKRFKEMGLFEKPKLLLLSENPMPMEGTWKSILKKWGESFSLYCLGTPKFDCPEGVVSIAEEQASVYNWERVIVPNCSVSTYVRIALGLRDDSISKLVGEALLKGITVEIFEPDFGFTPNTPNSYKHLYKNYNQQLQSFGVVITNSIWNVACIEQDSPVKAPVIQETETKTICFEKKLLGEKDALGLPPNCTLKITKRTVISPLAKDVLKMRKIQLDMNGEAFSCF